MTTTAVTPLAASLAMAPATTRAAQAIYGDFHHNTLPAEFFLASSSSSAIVASNFNAIKLSSDAQLCPRHLAHLSSLSSSSNNNNNNSSNSDAPNIPVPDCPLGRRCPFRHDAPSSLNFSAVPLRDPGKRTVCKHWLRGLCKKGDSCDYLHEYDLRRMPECRFFATFGFCNSGDECLYLHVDPRAKIRECEEYRRGFCPKGPKCSKKHVRRTACPHYLAGFCPKGPDCRLGHPKSTPPSAQSRSSSPVQTHKPLTAEEAFGPRGDRGDRGDQMRDYGGGGMGGGGGGGAGPMRNNFRQPRFNNNNDGDASQVVGGDPYSAPRGDRPMGNRNMMGAGGAGGGGGGGGVKRDLNEVTCFKCGDRGHFANACPNPNKPGNRGGTERGSGGRERGGGGGGGFYHKQQF